MRIILPLCLAAVLLGGAYAFADEAESANAAEHVHSYVAGKCQSCGDVLDDYKWYYGGSSPYSVSTGEEMAAFADLVNSGVDAFCGKTVNLTGNVDLPSDTYWTPIGKAEKVELKLENQSELDEAIKLYTIVYDNHGNSYSGSDKDNAYPDSDSDSDSVTYYVVVPSVFSGTFDGGGNEINYLNVNTDMGYAGLFGNVDGTLKNFTVDGKVTYSGQNGDYIGGVTGMLAEGGTISNVASSVTVVAMRGYNVGGITGFVGATLSGSSSANTVVTMCVNSGSVIGYNKVGGIAGENAGTITQCVNTGKVGGVNISSKNGVGGIAGRNGNNQTAAEAGVIDSCYNTGAINSLTGHAQWSGGIAGFNNSRSTVKNCYSTTCPPNAGSWSNPIIGKNEARTGVVENNYALWYSGISYTGSEEHETGILVNSEQLMALYDTVDIDSVERSLGEAYVKDSAHINDGYPILSWQAGEYTVTLNNMTKSAATVTELVSGGSYSGGISFSVSCDMACVVAYTTDGGETYTRLTATASAGGDYSFYVDLAANTEIAVVLRGDANGDGEVMASDALRIQRYLNPGYTTNNTLGPITMLAADANGDGEIMASDALRIQRYLNPGYTTNNTLEW